MWVVGRWFVGEDGEEEVVVGEDTLDVVLLEVLHRFDLESPLG